MLRTIPVNEAIGMVLAHDITEIRPGEFKGRAFRKGHIIRQEDVEHLRRLGKEHLYVLNIGSNELHENDAAYRLASALTGEGVMIEGEPKEGKINLLACRDGLLKVDHERLKAFNMLGDVMCATLHNNTVVRTGQVVAGTRAIPLVVKKAVVEEAIKRVQMKDPASSASGVIEVKELRKPRAGVVITGNEVYYGRIKDAFRPIIEKKVHQFGGKIVGVYYAPDDSSHIKSRLEELLQAGADLLITTGGMSVDPDDVTRFAIRELGVKEMHYGSAVLPGAMFLIAYLERSGLSNSESVENNSTPNTQHSTLIPILGIPACGMYHRTTIFDLVLPRILAGEHIGREELAEMGHGGLCLNCKSCHYPVCPFGK
ncbi:MAG: molybdopterin-binding protein [Nitrospirae bacterium]|nr:MAG: molybdopterin-binding protein [Nitrospirota bacterium]